MAAVTANDEPKNYGEAVKIKVWVDAMVKEIDALEINDTWEIVDLPPGKMAIGCNWIYKLKFNSDGTIERHKARLVSLGNRQTEDVDYDETFAHVVKMTTIRMFLKVAAAKQWVVHQMDVNNVFLHGDLEEEVYMRLPPGFKSAGSNKVCKLKKALYGLKQAPRCWFSKLTAALCGYGFKQSHSNSSLFMLTRGASRLYVLVYVDDLIIGDDDAEAVDRFKGYLGECFHMKDLGLLKYFLGIEVARSDKGFYLSQRKYVLDIINECGLLGGRTVTTPIEEHHQLLRRGDDYYEDPERYRRLIAYCDSDYAACPVTRRSLTGFAEMLGDSPINWKTKKQRVVSRSSTEAEYRSMADTTNELKWDRELLSCFGVQQTEPMRLYCDNQSALYIANNPVFHERTKNVETDCYYVRDEIQNGSLQTAKIHTSEQPADIFTKALGSSLFMYLSRKLGICDLHAPT
ncbi:unnamed protein product [Microthlaspi erraticum]|uniref:Reverse transcriptase Ty1/copia-type domain-containing protein n=1 Tax=Microthlaspi erraticum TaxID=1685480 RepID=A0A6D2KDW3_9BRAS|nr:unnamed protein product [Microthlaspi erraticum]CAA7052631.1 unnamed protein product [Microthlaspi erraticum]